MKTESVRNAGHYIHQINYNRRERLAGLFVFSALVLFAALFFLSSKSQHFLEQQVRFYINVNSSEGIDQENVVTLLGVEVGKVSNLELMHGRKIHVTIDVYKRHHKLIRADAKVVVNRLINLGSALIEIHAGSVDAPVLEEGATIPVEETPSLNDLVLGIARIVQSTDSGLLKDISEMMPKLEQTVENAQKIIAQIASGQGTLGAAVFDLKVEQELKQVVQSGSQILTDADSIVSIAKQRLVELEPVISGAEQVLDDLQETTQNLPQTVVELKKTLALTNSALKLVNDELRHMPGMVLDARRTLVDAERVLEGTQHIWPLSTVIQKPADSPLIPPHPLHD